MLSIRIVASVAASIVAFGPQLAFAKCVTQETQMPNIDQTNDLLNAIAAVSSSDAWAVGFTDISGSPSQQLIEHFDGAQWSIVAPPGSLYNAYLTGVSAFASNDVWAVGSVYGRHTLPRPLNIHWDGSAWTVIPGPANPPHRFVDISAVSANPTRSDDVWAVGSYWNADFDLPVASFAEHWDGTSWKASGNVPGVQLYGVSTLSDGEAWAVGSNTCARGCQDTPIIVHWDGTRWNVSNGAFQHGILNSVSAQSAHDVWAIGPVIERYDGHKWTIVSSPNPGTNVSFNSITAASPTDAWAVGFYKAPFSTNVLLAFLEHWNGTAWAIVPSPSAAVGTIANGVAHVSGLTMTVGESSAESPFQPAYAKTFGFTSHC